MNNELPKTKIDERTGIEYHLEGDYYIPNLAMPKQEKIVLNKYCLLFHCHCHQICHFYISHH